MSYNPLTPKKAKRIGARFGYPDVVAGYTGGGWDHAFYLQLASGGVVQVFPTKPPTQNRPLVRRPTGGGDGEGQPQQQGD